MADSTKNSEIEVTPEMIEAGVKAISPLFDEDATLSSIFCREAASKAIRAGVRVYSLKNQ